MGTLLLILLSFPALLVLLIAFLVVLFSKNERKKKPLATIAVLIFGVLSFDVYSWHSVNKSEYGLNEEDPQLDWIPAEAQNVTFYSDWVIKSAEFSVDEESMIAWAKSIERPLERIKEEREEGYEVHRSRGMLEHLGVIERLPEPKTMVEIEEWLNTRDKNFDVGDLYYSVRWSNGGGYWIGYDVSEGRGYYHYASH